MRAAIPALLVVTSACSAAVEPAAQVVPLCNVIEEHPVDDGDDADLGFSVNELVGTLDGRDWAARWVANEDGQDLPNFDLAGVRSSVTRTVLPASVRVSEDAMGGCPIAGTFLFAPVDLQLEDDGGTFSASASGYVAASAPGDASIVIGTNDTWLDVRAVPEDIAEAGEETALTHDPDTTRHEIGAMLAGTGERLDLDLAVLGEGDASYTLTLGKATLFAP